MDAVWTREMSQGPDAARARSMAPGPDRWSKVCVEHGKQKSVYRNGTWRARDVPEVEPGEVQII